MRVFAVILLLTASFSLALAASKYRLAAESSTLFVCGDEKLEAHIRQLMIGALDSSLHSHVAHTFEVWMKDSTGQPQRARTGVDRGVAAYIHSLEGLKQWKLPRC